MRTGAFKKTAAAAVILLAFSAGIVPARAQEIQPPREFLGYEPGADFHYAGWDSIVIYFRQLAAQSDRVLVQDFGTSTMGNPMLAVIIADSRTMAEIEQHKADQRKIADPRLISGAREREILINESKPVVLLNMQLHSTEAAASQMSMELAYELATLEDAVTKNIREKSIMVLVPCANPDGQKMVTKYYKQSLGTPWEGGWMPWLYHTYAGHDNNRDWFMLNLKETRAETRLLYKEWLPTIVWDIHQTGRRSYRLFLPPFHDPKNPNSHRLIERMLYSVGGYMASRLSSLGMTGVIHGVSYDNYWAGGFRTTPHRHNMLGLLSEAASVNIASPVFLRGNELDGEGRGMNGYKTGVNFPDPWPGGWWRLRDIVEYEKAAAFALADYTARFHDVLQENYIRMGEEAVEKGKNEPPFAWIVPLDQKDCGTALDMLERLHATGIEMYQADEDFMADNARYTKGSIIMYCAQPYRPHLMDMMERQHYPVRVRYPGGPPEAPYDMAGWTLPLMMGVRYAGIAEPFVCMQHRLDAVPDRAPAVTNTSKRWFALTLEQNDTYRLINRLLAEKQAYMLYTGKDAGSKASNGFVPGTVLVQLPYHDLKPLIRGLAVTVKGMGRPPASILDKCVKIRSVRTGLYKPWTASMDEGWTRYVLDSFEYQYESLTNARIAAGNLRSQFDCIIIPSIRPRSIINGRDKGTAPPRYTGGIGTAGVCALQEFVQQGGTLVCIDRSSNLVIDHFTVPVTNIITEKTREEFYCPGSVLRLSMDTSHPLGYGMSRWYNGCFTNSQAFETHIQRADSAVSPVSRVDVVSRYGGDAILQSGWINSPEIITGKPAVVELQYGQGHIDLLGIHVQNRAQPHGTFRILFNAVQRSVL